MLRSRPLTSLFPIYLLVVLLAAAPVLADDDDDPNPELVIDIATLIAGVDPLIRVSGATDGGPFTLGSLGTPVAAGGDVDGDGFEDYAIAHIFKDPVGFPSRPFAGEVNLVFGDGTASGAIDLGALPDSRVLEIRGPGNLGVTEMTGSEIWIGDVTGDGIAELLICVQNFSFGTPTGPRFGAGALIVLTGGPALRNVAGGLQPLDFAAPFPPGVSAFVLLGAHAFARLGIWVRVGDVDGDGVADVVVASDQESTGGDVHNGAVYVVRGGAHLAQTSFVDLAGFGATSLAGNIARIAPPAGSNEFHLGGTAQVGDLDGNGRAEVLVAATINRAGAGLGPFGFNSTTTHGRGGVGTGRTYVVWDDLFPAAPWPAGLSIDLGASPASLTVIDGGVQNRNFGEELLSGDFDDDGRGDLFVGDLAGDGTDDQSRPTSGVGYVFYRAERLKGDNFGVDSPPRGSKVTKILGPIAGAIGSDTVAVGDFNGDGRDDLVIGNPHDSPQGRIFAGSMHVLFGREGRWPRLIDTAPGQLPDAERVSITEVQGAVGTNPGVFTGDTLCYSAAAGDVDGDGRTDIVTNEMVGNGVTPADLDVGNLIVLAGPELGGGDDDDEDSDSDSDSDSDD